jgi:hypothetical protein
MLPSESTVPSHMTRHLGAEGADEFQIMLDDDDAAVTGDAAEQGGGVLGFLVRHAGDGFVHQEELWFLHQQHADFQPLPLAVGEDGGAVPCPLGEADFRQGGFDAALVFGTQHPAEAGPRVARRLQGEFEVLEHREGIEDRWLLELAADAEIGDGGFIQARQVVVPELHGAGGGDGSCR